MKETFKYGRTIFFWMMMACLFSLPSFAQNNSTYIVKPGDTLFSIAAAYSMSVEDLKTLNNLEGGVIRAGMELTVQQKVKPSILSTPTPESARVEPLRVQADGLTETLASIAERLQLSEDEVLLLNPDIQQVIDRLNSISPAVEQTTSSYTVKAGDTMFSIAKANGLSVAQLVELNGLSKTSIQSGQRLKVPGSEPAGTSTWSSEGILDAIKYPETFSNRLMAGQITYDGALFVVGHSTLPIGSLIMVGKANEGPTVMCIVADESLSVSLNILDVSQAVAEAVGLGENERIEIYTLK